MNHDSSNKNDPPEVAEIQISDFSIDVPGVTQLLNPGIASLRKIREKPDQSNSKGTSSSISIHLDSPASPPPFSASTPAPADATRVMPSPTKANTAQEVSLESLGVTSELVFFETQGVFRFQSFKEVARNSFPDWKKSFFNKMKIDFKTLGITVSFQEFSAQQFPFQKDALGLENGQYALFFRSTNQPKRLFLLFSNQSLMSKQALIESHYAKLSNPSDAPPSDSKSEVSNFKIELAS